MYDFPIALQLYSVRDDMEADFVGTLKKVKKFGYDGVEFAGLFNYTAEEVKKMCTDVGLVPISAHVSYYELLKGEAIFKLYADIGCKYIVVPWIDEECLAGGEKCDWFYGNMEALGKTANKYGMKLCYHNHDFEFKKIDGKNKIDFLYEAVPSKFLSTQLDTCWVNVGGENPADFIRKYNGRVEIVHLKDFAGSKNDNMYALIGENKSENAKGEFELRPVGYGLQDFPSILAACKDVNTKWVIVEQDLPSMNKTPLECAELSIKYLKSIY